MIETPLRPRLELATGWEHVRGRAGRRWLRGETDGGEPVELPHSWNEADTYQFGRLSYAGRAAYRRAVELDAAWSAPGRRIVLETGGFYGTGDLWFDGRKLARFDAQYLGVAVELPPGIASGRHQLALRLDNRWRRSVLPGTSEPDFVLYGGLAGGVRLVSVPATRIEVESVRLSTRAEGRDERISIDAAVTHAGSAARASLEWTITDREGAVVANAPTLDLQLARATNGQVSAPTAELRLVDVRTWSPDDPYLYRAVGTLAVDGVVVDQIRIRFGVPRLEVRAGDGLLLDGKKLELHGCNRHESIPGLGSALPDDLQRHDAELMAELGCNFVRLSHYPQSPAFLDACDELGLLVYAELASWKSVRSSFGWRRAARRQFHDLIVRDRHRPSLLFWGMGNESRSRRAYLELAELAHRLDPGRPTTYAENHFYRARRKRILGIPDVWSVNYELEALAEGASASRIGLVLVSECCNHPKSLRGVDTEERIQLGAIERDWEAMAGRERMVGYAIWCLTDYATEHRGRIRREPGLLDAWRLPKLAADLFRARHGREPFVALHRTAGGPPLPPSRFRLDLDPERGAAADELHLFTNCGELRLELDGAPWRAVGGAPHLVLGAPAAEREIVAIGCGRGVEGGDAPRAVLRPHGPAARIVLALDGDALPAGATRALEVAIVDAAGARVRDWRGEIVVEATGAGRVRSFRGDGALEVARGVGRTFVTAAHAGGAVVIVARAPGLEPARLEAGYAP